MRVHLRTSILDLGRPAMHRIQDRVSVVKRSANAPCCAGDWNANAILSGRRAPLGLITLRRLN